MVWRRASRGEEDEERQEVKLAALGRLCGESDRLCVLWCGCVVACGRVRYQNSRTCTMYLTQLLQYFLTWRTGEHNFFSEHSKLLATRPTHYSTR